jgi:hypothetical protein
LIVPTTPFELWLLRACVLRLAALPREPEELLPERERPLLDRERLPLDRALLLRDPAPLLLARVDAFAREPDEPLRDVPPFDADARGLDFELPEELLRVCLLRDVDLLLAIGNPSIADLLDVNTHQMQG